ncbi:hypothetical protein VNO77_37917 [Canavalia gladiata]|uniref:Uncharacterized protein n=1 Tax=Canavalia gladiata TaxID=3824 RepID=A0AAN9PXB9_CANGL
MENRKYPLDFGEGRTFKIVAKALRLILAREELDSGGEHSIEDSDNPLDCSSRLYPRLSCFFRIVMRMPLPRKLVDSCSKTMSQIQKRSTASTCVASSPAFC